MLFQSYGFVFGFLPLVVIACQLLRQPKIDARWRTYVLVAASLFFYGYLSSSSLPFLAVSCLLNFTLGLLIHRAQPGNRPSRGQLTAIGIAANVGLLIALKYSAELGWSGVPGGYFPLGASFITFIQIVYLFETFDGSLRKLSLAEYLQVSVFLGYATSGPVVSATEVIAENDSPDNRHHLSSELVMAAVALFAMGLFKKLVIADSVAPYASSIFDAAQKGLPISASDAWLGSTLYMLQLYFDFSGYSDMAVAIGCLVGMRLPLNFNSPFKATSVMDYWRRWHMTLTRFITRYLYLPLAVKLTRWTNDKNIEPEPPRFFLTVALPILVAFIVAGVWHGNGWTFFAYGVYWGIALSVYQAWDRFTPVRLPQAVAWALTMVTALGSLVLFRSSSLNAAGAVMKAALHFNGGVIDKLPSFMGVLVLFIMAALVLLPNSQQILGRYRLSSDEVDAPVGRLSWLAWSATPAGAVVLGVTLVAALLMGGGPTQFLYYKF
jgi:alginate O-acetyltransferase complex protein AlgI